MNREEAAEVLDNLCTRLNCEDDISGAEARAFYIALTALSGWVRTADRVPTENDGYVIAAARTTSNLGYVPVALWYVTVNKTMHPYWMPLPPLPVTTKGETHD